MNHNINICETCAGPTLNAEDAYGEFVCDSCLDNEAEAAYERHCADFHDGGATQFITLAERQAEARKLK
jgi:hypothetical protein